MALHVFVLLLVACLLLCLARLGRLDWLSPRPSSKGATKRTTVQRLLQRHLVRWRVGDCTCATLA